MTTQITPATRVFDQLYVGGAWDAAGYHAAADHSLARHR